MYSSSNAVVNQSHSLPSKMDMLKAFAAKGKLETMDVF